MQLGDPSTVLWVVPLVVGGAVASTVAVVAVRRERSGAYAELTRPYAAVAVAFGVAALSYGVLRQTTGVTGRGAWLTVYLVAVPWTVFAVRYAGYGGYVTRRRVVAVAVATLSTLLVSAALLFEFPVTVAEPVRERVDVVVSLFTLSLLTLGTAAAALVGVSAYRHDRLSAATALVAVWPLAHPVATVQLTRPATPTVNVVLSSALFLGAPVALAVGVGRYDLVDYPAGVDTIGERAVFADTAAAVFVLDVDDRVVRSNAAARATFGDVSSLADVTDCGTETLASRETVACWTAAGRRQFDPRVTPLYTDGGATLGHAVTFVDVTTREIRRQRLSVLNRVLRHNVRNQLDVIRAHAEEAGAESAVDGVDRLDSLAGEIRRVERLLDREGTGERRVPLASFLETTVASVAETAAADTTVAAPDGSVTVDADLCEYVVANLVEAAVDHSDGRPRVAVRGRRTDTGVRIVVADDGPGIPASERAAVEAGEETPLSHATSVGLWGTRWAVGAMNGSLSFGDSDLGGTEVVVELPEGSSVTEGASTERRSSRDGDAGSARGTASTRDTTSARGTAPSEKGADVESDPDTESGGERAEAPSGRSTDDTVIERDSSSRSG